MIAFFAASRKKLQLLCMPFLVLLLASCDLPAIGQLGGPKIDPNAPVPVALLIPRGGSAGDNVLAKNLENAARMAIRDLDGVQIDLRVYGTAGKPGTAATAAAQAVTEGAKIILGPVYAESANAAGVAVAKSGVNVLAFSNNPTIAGANVFVLGPTFANTANRLSNYAKRAGKNRVVILHANDIAGQLGKVAITQAATANGVAVVGSVDYALSQQSVAAAGPRVKAAIAAGKADALFLTSNSAAALPLFSQILPGSGVTNASAQYIGLTRWDVPRDTLTLQGLDGGWFATPDPNASASFNQRFSAAYGASPHPLAGLAFDGVAAVGALVKSRKGAALTGSALTQKSGFKGATGIFRLRPDGTNERGLAVAVVRNKGIAILEPAPQNFGGAGF